jgi:hypothetical protein
MKTDIRLNRTQDFSSHLTDNAVRFQQGSRLLYVFSEIITVYCEGHTKDVSLCVCVCVCVCACVCVCVDDCSTM